MHREVVALVEQGTTAEQILESFVAQHGEMVLMAPKKAGFNLFAYFVPGVAIAVVGSTILWVLSRRRVAVASPTAAPTPAQARESIGLAESEQERLNDELQRLEQ
jgi:cytochrome c-type biogenesis protein CcmH/NrfF